MGTSGMSDAQLSTPSSSSTYIRSHRQMSKGASLMLKFWSADRPQSIFHSLLTDPAMDSQVRSVISDSTSATQVNAWAQEAISALPEEQQSQMISGLSQMAEGIKGLTDGSLQDEFNQFMASTLTDPEMMSLMTSMTRGQSLPSLQESMDYFNLGRSLNDLNRALATGRDSGWVNGGHGPERTISTVSYRQHMMVCLG